MANGKTVEDFFARQTTWEKEVSRLRAILQKLPLEEALKWGTPCYSFNGKNVVGIGSFKAYFGLWFFQGALLEDSAGVLQNAQQGKTRAMRQWRMQHAKDIKARLVTRYVREAITHIEAGREIKADRRKTLEVPDALARGLRRQKGATAAFRALRPGQQREYADFIASAKREDTLKRRLDKVLPLIASGRGLHDKYRK